LFKSRKENIQSRLFTLIILILFAIDQKNYKLRDIWILDLETNSYIYNNSSRFKFERLITENNQLIADKSIYLIKTFESVNIFIQISIDLKMISLINITLAPDFFINIIFLHQFILKGVYWDIEKQRLYY